MKEQHYKELGILIVQFQNLEQTIAFFTTELISTDQTLGNILISKMSFRNLCEVFTALFNYRCKNPELNKELKGIFARIKKIEDKRNAYVHSTWGFPASNLGDGALRIKKKIKKNELSFDLEVLKEDDMKNIRIEIQNAMNDFLDFMKKVKKKNLIAFSTLVNM